MNLITDPLRQLVRRKLWPVALLLVGGLVAVPVLLAKQPEPSVATSPVRMEKTEGVPATFVSVAEDGEVTERRRVLCQTKDPFEPRTLPKKKKAKTAKADPTATATAAPEDRPAETTPSTGGGGGGGTVPTTEPPVSATPTAEPKPKVPANSVNVRFGTSDAEELESQTLERMTALPSEEEPTLVFMELEDNGKTAVFMLAGEVTAQGDGECLPTPEDCQTLKLRVGETEFFDVVAPDAEAAEPVQYQLDVVKINKK
jgi:hypothetical protein